MRKKLMFVLWLGRVLIEAAEVAVAAKRALDSAWGNPWRRPMPWGTGSYWQRKD